MTKTGSGKASPHSPELPDDVVSEILSWLPPKIIWKFRIVSLSWYNQIAHPSFIKKQKSNFSERYDENGYYFPCYLPNYIPVSDPCDFIVEACNGLSCNENYDENDDYFPSYLPSYILTYDPFAIIVGSCNGLLCYSNTSKSRIYLHNPSTEKTILLPRDPFAAGRDSTHGIIRTGLCYDESNHDFKVVIIPAARLDDDNSVVAVTISIYSLKNNSWERVKSVIPRWIPFCFSVSFGLKETIYWHCTSTLIAFDSSKLAFRVIPYPDLSGVLYPLTIVKSSLWIMGFDGYKNLCAWMIKQDEEGEIWEKKFECSIAKGRYVLALSYQGKILLRAKRRRKNMFVILDPETKKEKTIGRRDKKNLRLLKRRLSKGWNGATPSTYQFLLRFQQNLFSLGNFWTVGLFSI